MKPNIKRLRRLAKHIVSKNRLHMIFNFRYFNNTLYDRTTDVIKGIPNCGTVGCALGECPALWKGWSFDEYGKLIYKGKNINIGLVKIFFGLTTDQAKVLFYPSSFHYGRIVEAETLSDHATAEEVSQNILNFCDYIEKHENT